VSLRRTQTGHAVLAVSVIRAQGSTAILISSKVTCYQRAAYVTTADLLCYDHSVADAPLCLNGTQDPLRQGAGSRAATLCMSPSADAGWQS